MPVKIHQVVSNMFGKFPDGSYNEMVLFEEEYYAKYLSNYLPRYFKELETFE